MELDMKQKQERDLQIEKMELDMEQKLDLEQMVEDQNLKNLNDLMVEAGFKPDTPLSKVKKIIMGQKWKPTTIKTKIASQKLFDYFVEEETEKTVKSNRFIGMCKDWGYYCGLQSCDKVTSEEKSMFFEKMWRCEQTINEKFGIDVSKWGNPLEYQVQEN